MLFYIYSLLAFIGRRLGVIVFNATFNNISVILWWSVLLVEETGEYLDKTTNLSYVTDKIAHIMFQRVHLAMSGIQTRNFSGDRKIQLP